MERTLVDGQDDRGIGFRWKMFNDAVLLCWFMGRRNLLDGERVVCKQLERRRRRT